MKRTIVSIFAVAAAAVSLCGCSIGAIDNHSEGMKLYSEGKYDQATTKLMAAVAENNSKGIYYVDLGMNYIATGDFELAKESFDHAVSIGDEDELAYRGLGIMTLQQGLYADSVAYFDKAIDAIDMSVGELEYDILKYKAEALTKAGDYEEAISVLDSLILLGVDVNANKLKKGDVYLLMGDGKSALDCFDLALAENGSVENYISIYNSFYNLGLYEQGMSYLNRALVVEGESAEAHLNRGKIYYIMNNYVNAATEFKFAVEGTDQSIAAEAYMYLAFCYEKENKLTEAIDAYYASLRNGEKPEVYNYLAMCLSENGENNLAWNQIHQTIEKFPDAECMQDLIWNEIVLYERMEMFPSAYTRLTEDYMTVYPVDSVVEKEYQFLKLKQ